MAYWPLRATAAPSDSDGRRLVSRRDLLRVILWIQQQLPLLLEPQ